MTQGGHYGVISGHKMPPPNFPSPPLRRYALKEDGGFCDSTSPSRFILLPLLFLSSFKAGGPGFFSVLLNTKCYVFAMSLSFIFHIGT